MCVGCWRRTFGSYPYRSGIFNVALDKTAKIPVGKYRFVRLLFYILVIGNMMGRTTTVGAVIAIAYLAYSIVSNREIQSVSIRSFYLRLFG